MKIQEITQRYSVSEQISPEDVAVLAEQGVDVLICNRPDGEAQDQPAFAVIAQAAEVKGMRAVHIPFVGDQITDAMVDEFNTAVGAAKKVHAYCRTGNRSTKIWQKSQADAVTGDASSKKAKPSENSSVKPRYDIVIVGAGSGGVATAASLLKRKPHLRICLIDPAQMHYYQPGWTMVGGGVFQAETTGRIMEVVIPNNTTLIKEAVEGFDPSANKVVLSSGQEVFYEQLVLSPGLKLNWSAVEGLEETLGKNGVTSNYRYDLAPYTWELVSNLNKGKALFTQPPMPIKCAGAPQKAMYLSGDAWLKRGVLKDIDIEFYNAGAVLFGVKDYVPALESYVEKYQAKLNFSHNLVKVDGENQRAIFELKNAEGETQLVESEFDMMHVCPPQCAQDFIKASVLSDDAGWIDVDQFSLRHKKFDNVWGLGDGTNTPNAKTMAAARKQAPVVAHNICDVLDGKEPRAEYDGYGSCPLTVERGKIVLAEFGYGGKLLPTFPSWVNDGTKPTSLAWILKQDLLPPFYWQGMLKGREWFVSPKLKS